MKKKPKSKWIKYYLEEDIKLPSLPGCYVIYLNREPVYVGQTTNIRNRLKNHVFRRNYGGELITPWGQMEGEVDVYVKIRFSKRLGDWAMWEIRLIHRLKPRFNVVCRGSRCRIGVAQ